MTDEPDHELLELETRRRIYHEVRRTPGVHFRDLQRRLEMAVGTLEYNLRELEKEDLVVTRDEGYHKAYFVGADTGMDRRDRDYMLHLRQEFPRRVAMEVAHDPGVQFKTLRERIGIYPSRLSYHLKRLEKAGIIRSKATGREKHYVCEEPQRVRRLIIQYQESFADRAVDRFADTWSRL